MFRTAVSIENSNMPLETLAVEKREIRVLQIAGAYRLVSRIAQ
jgi:hypothetical protein